MTPTRGQARLAEDRTDRKRYMRSDAGGNASADAAHATDAAANIPDASRSCSGVLVKTFSQDSIQSLQPGKTSSQNSIFHSLQLAKTLLKTPSFTLCN
eukprot:6185104-Pleurochrysis_carterae.AAC.2